MIESLVHNSFQGASLMGVVKPLAGQVELDLGRYELRRSGRRVKLEKKPMELLIFLVGRRDQMVSREDIVKKLWRSNLFIDTERNINNIVRKIRTALGDSSDRPRFLETVVGKGYRFIGPVRVIGAQYPRVASAQSSAEAEGARSANDWSGHVSLAVLPLALVGKVADNQGLCLGFADALVARLANLRDVNVLPTSAVLDLPSDAPVAETASRLGIRFVVHGGIQWSKEQWRLSLEMFDSHLQGPCLTRKCDLDMDRLPETESDVARQIAGALKRPLVPATGQAQRYSSDPLAYAEFMRGYRLSVSGDSFTREKSIQYLTNAVTRDPAFALAQATLSLECASRHFEYDPASMWLEKAEFHCRRALEINPELPEGHVARAFLLWGPSKNFQHVEAIAALKRALTLQNNLPHAYNRLGTILAHIGLLDHAREMYERGRPFHPRKAVSHSIVQVHIWSRDYELAQQEIDAWRAESPGNKYAIYFAPVPAMMTGAWKEAKRLLDEALH